MGEEIGTTYFSYRGPSPSPSPHDTINNSHINTNRNTVRSVHSTISDRGGSNEIATLAVRPYQYQNIPEASSVIFLSPPYPTPFPPQPHPPYYNINSNGTLPAPPYTQLDHIRKKRLESAKCKVHSDFTTTTENFRLCVLFLGIIFTLAMGVTIFMAVYYGNNFSG